MTCRRPTNEANENGLEPRFCQGLSTTAMRQTNSATQYTNRTPQYATRTTSNPYQSSRINTLQQPRTYQYPARQPAKQQIYAPMQRTTNTPVSNGVNSATRPSGVPVNSQFAPPKTPTVVASTNPKVLASNPTGPKSPAAPSATPTQQVRPKTIASTPPTPKPPAINPSGPTRRCPIRDENCVVKYQDWPKNQECPGRETYTKKCRDAMGNYL